MFFANGVAAQAQTPAVSPVTASDVVAGPSGNSDRDPQGSDEESPEKTAVVEQPVGLKSAGESSAPKAKAEEGSREESEAEVKSSQPETKIDDKGLAPVADTSAAQSIQGTLEALLANLTLDSMKALHTEVEEALAKAKAVLENPKATQEQVDEQVKLMEDLIRRVKEALSPQVSTPSVLEKAGLTNHGLAAPEGAVTNQGSRGKRRKKGDLSQATPAVDQTSPETGGNSEKTESSENPSRQELPTYTNQGDGAYKLKDELEFIYKRLQKEGVEESKIQTVKAAADKFNEAFSRGETISQDAFDAALVDLKKSRDLIEGVLTGRENEINSNGIRLRRVSRSAISREAGKRFVDSKEYYYEDGKQGVSPYPRYTYIFHSDNPTQTAGYSHVNVSEAEKYIRARVTATRDGFLWEITVNAGKFQGLTNDSYWFTIPKGQTYKPHSATVDVFKPEGTTSYSSGNDTIESTLARAGLGRVHKGDNFKGVFRPGRLVANAYNTNDLEGLARESVDALTDKGFYKRELENGSEQILSNQKFDLIKKKGGTLYYFEQPDNNFKYTLTFQTTGDNNLADLVYAAGFKGVRAPVDSYTKRHRVLVNQWYARTQSETDGTYEFPMKLKENGTFFINQDKYYNKAFPYSDHVEGGIYGGQNRNLDDVRHLDGLVSYSEDAGNPRPTIHAIDFTSYVEYKGYNIEEGKRKANSKGQTFTFFKDGNRISKEQLGLDAGSKPGLHTYTYTRRFSDGSEDSGTFNFVTKAEKPTFNQTLKFIGERQNISARTNKEGIPLTLYRDYGGAEPEVVAEVVSGKNGVASFENIEIKQGKYYVRTVIKTDAYVDYDGNTHRTVESDPVNENEKLVAVEAPTVKLNGKKLTTNADDNRFIIYRGAVFNPTFRVENDGKQVNSLKASGIPKGVWFNKVNGGDQPRTNMAHGSEYTISANNVVDSDTRLGEGTATVTVVNHQGKSIDYKFKYIVADVQGKNTTENKLVGDTIGNAHRFAKATIGNAEGDDYFPKGMAFKWVTNTLTLPENTEKLGEAGRITNYNAQVIFPNGGPFKKTIGNDEYTIYGPIAKTIPVTFNVTDNVAPTVKLGTGNGGTILTESESNAPEITIYRGASFTDTIKVFDNESRGIVNLKVESGLPDGLSLEGKSAIKKTSATEGHEATVNISGKVATTARLGVYNVNLKVSDDASGNVDRGNTKTVKFKVKVLDLAFETRGKAINENTHSDTLDLNQTSVDANHYLTVTDGINKADMFPQGMIFRYILADGTIRNTLSFDKPGKYTVTAAAYYPIGEKSVAGAPVASTNLKGEDISGIAGRPYLTKQIIFEVKPTAPTVAAKDNGDVEITPTNQTNVDKVSVTFTKQADSTVVTYTAKKNDRGVWEFGADAPLTVDPTTGVFRLKDRVVKDGTTVTAKALTTDGTGNVQSNPVTGKAGNGDAVLPEIEFKNTVIDSTGDRVVYITPTETTNVEVATVNDNSKKLLEAVFFDQGAQVTDLGNYGITYNKVIRNGDTITNAPYTLTVTGTLNREKSANTLWNDGDVIATRYVSAMDAAENNIREKSGSRDNVASNPYRVVFKVRTQAAKYTPQVTNLTRHDQQPKHTNEDVKGAVTGENIKSKEVLDPIPDESGNVRVKVTYTDDSSETVTVPIKVTPSKATQGDPTVSELTRHDQQPKHTNEDVKGAVTGENIKSKEVLDPIPDESGNVRVKVTYTDDSSEEATVKITVVGLPETKVPVESFGNLTKEEQDKVKESVEKANPGKTVVVEPTGKVTITDPKTNTSHEISEELVTTIAPPVVDIPEFNGGVNGEPERQEELPEFNGGTNGEPEIQPELPDFTGGVNGELPDPAELPKVKLFITKWIDENGNELKPADAKAPTVLGEANEAFEHGEIEGYVFVRTETKGDVVTHIFRKVSPVRPTGDDQQRPTTPSADTNRRPDTATPAEVPATHQAEQPSQTVEVPAQLPNEVSETDPSVSQPQAVLPNTGTQEDRATGAFGVLSLLGAFGLLFAKKKKDDEEEA
ncbi:hypothetical protein STYK_06300 [Streptococcus toyakuensis]|uniref:LPXTG cell wall anchor domain-containing protein n=2 Tax=Streptococcus toyakuensis TaxID=2819619 RepID=A0ABM7USR3_9STRE|nr:hypothetical protein STYK_06300 [Streptococcus toyakuensis]